MVDSETIWSAGEAKLRRNAENIMPQLCEGWAFHFELLGDESGPALFRIRLEKDGEDSAAAFKPHGLGTMPDEILRGVMWTLVRSTHEKVLAAQDRARRETMN